MDQGPNSKPRRRKMHPVKIFLRKHKNLIIGVSVLVFTALIIVIAAVSSGQRAERARQESLAAQESLDAQNAVDRQEADRIIAEAEAVAATYDFDGAIAVLDSFGTKLYEFDDMLELRDKYEYTKNNLVAYTGSDTVHLSVQVLIADADRAFASKEHGAGFKRNFITTDEFRNLLQQLHSNGYVLIDMDDVVEVLTDEDGNTYYSEKSVMLPESKKPLMLTQTQVNYYTYMVDPDGDGIADENGAGFANRLILENGKLTNAMVDKNGNTVTGAYDLVPILEEFLLEHPDFSYGGARPLLALTGYDGIFGYRGDALSEVTPVLEALREKDYKFGYYTYYNTSFAKSSAAKITDEGERWSKHIVPVLGETPYMVYALSGDIESANKRYSGEKFEALQAQGLRYYLGFCDNGEPWFLVESGYVRMGRILANANNLRSNPEWFAGICDPTAVLVENR